MASASASPAVDFAAIKAKQQAIWASGDYTKIGIKLQIVAESLVEIADVGPGDKVLDVASGPGNAALAAARRGADVVASDYVPELLERARRRAEADDLPVAIQVADAEALPFDDASFDVVLSTFGVMFAPSQETAAAELARVTRPGGHVALANWTPDGFIGQMLKTVAKFVPPPAGVRSPALWGSEEHVAALFGDRARLVNLTKRQYVFRYESADHFVEFFRRWYGPTHKAFGALAEDQQALLAGEIAALARRFDRGDGRRLDAVSDYLEIVLERR